MRDKVAVQVVAITLIAVMGLTGCARKKMQPVNTVYGSGSGGLPPATGVDLGGGASGVGSTGIMGERPILTPADEASRGMFVPVYFDYDSARIKPTELKKLETVAAALRGNSKKLLIEGHCDERGTAEYNRALGERRAQSALSALAKLGIETSRMSTISYGKDRPAVVGYDESAWSRNRRAEFVIVGQ